MGEKETAEAMAAGRTRTGNTVSLDDKQGTVSAAERDEETDTDAGDASLKTRHDTVKNSIGNIR